MSEANSLLYLMVHQVTKMHAEEHDHTIFQPASQPMAPKDRGIAGSDGQHHSSEARIAWHHHEASKPSSRDWLYIWYLANYVMYVRCCLLYMYIYILQRNYSITYVCCFCTDTLLIMYACSILIVIACCRYSVRDSQGVCIPALDCVAVWWGLILCSYVMSRTRSKNRLASPEDKWLGQPHATYSHQTVTQAVSQGRQGCNPIFTVIENNTNDRTLARQTRHQIRKSRRSCWSSSPSF